MPESPAGADASTVPASDPAPASAIGMTVVGDPLEDELDPLDEPAGDLEPVMAPPEELLEDPGPVVGPPEDPPEDPEDPLAAPIPEELPLPDTPDDEFVDAGDTELPGALPLLAHPAIASKASHPTMNTGGDFNDFDLKGATIRSSAGRR